jgi:hypothetical protein
MGVRHHVLLGIIAGVTGQSREDSAYDDQVSALCGGISNNFNPELEQDGERSFNFKVNSVANAADADYVYFKDQDGTILSFTSMANRNFAVPFDIGASNPEYVQAFVHYSDCETAQSTVTKTWSAIVTEFLASDATWDSKLTPKITAVDYPSKTATVTLEGVEETTGEGTIYLYAKGNNGAILFLQPLNPTTSPSQVTRTVKLDTQNEYTVTLSACAADCDVWPSRSLETSVVTEIESSNSGPYAAMNVSQEMRGDLLTVEPSAACGLTNKYVLYAKSSDGTTVLGLAQNERLSFDVPSPTPASVTLFQLCKDVAGDVLTTAQADLTALEQAQQFGMERARDQALDANPSAQTLSLTCTAAGPVLDAVPYPYGGRDDRLGGCGSRDLVDRDFDGRRRHRVRPVHETESEGNGLYTGLHREHG